MENQIVKQATVVSMDAPNPSRITEKIALFNPDGSPLQILSENAPINTPEQKLVTFNEVSTDESYYGEGASLAFVGTFVATRSVRIWMHAPSPIVPFVESSGSTVDAILWVGGPPAAFDGSNDESYGNDAEYLTVSEVFWTNYLTQPYDFVEGETYSFSLVDWYQYDQAGTEWDVTNLHAIIDAVTGATPTVRPGYLLTVNDEGVLVELDKNELLSQLQVDPGAMGQGHGGISGGGGSTSPGIKSAGVEHQMGNMAPIGGRSANNVMMFVLQVTWDDVGKTGSRRVRVSTHATDPDMGTNIATDTTPAAGTWMTSQVLTFIHNNSENLYVYVTHDAEEAIAPTIYNLVQQPIASPWK